MPIQPLVIPARPETVFDQIRVAAMSVTQHRAGGPINVQFQLDYYAVVDGVPVDAPPGTSVSGSVQYGVQTFLGHPQLGPANQAISEVIVEEAIRAGVLIAAPETGP